MNQLKKVNAIDISGLAKKTDYNTKIKGIEDKIPNLADTTALNCTINEVKGEITSITGLANTTAVNDVKNNTPDALVKKADYDIKNVEIEKKLDHDLSNKCITTQEFNNLTANKFEARLKQANLATKGEIADFIKKTDFDDKPKKFKYKNFFK